MGKHSVLRDAYLYACPILSDRETVDVFNAKMMEDRKRPKTMWRITSNGDFVATCLPELGDYTSIAVSPSENYPHFLSSLFESLLTTRTLYPS